MIKNFLEADEDDSLITKQSFGEKSANENEFENFAAPFSKIEDEPDLLEMPESKAVTPNISENEAFAAEPTNLDSLIEKPSNDFSVQAAFHPTNAPFSAASVEDVSEKTSNNDYANDAPIFASQFQPESQDETIRKSGLAYSAAIILFASIVFTLILGWFADLLFGTSPWGKVGGIVIGAIIGFIQFFRTTSQILKDKD